MCIYCNTTNYRKIYENHIGPIPVEPDGRKYHIHHKDGIHENNHPTNLEALTIQEHYNRHYSQGDWLACHRLALIMKLTVEEVSALASLNALKQIDEGRHPFVGGEVQRRNAAKRLADGTHPFLNTEMHREVNRQRVDAGTHNLLGPAMNNRLLASGKHVSQNKEFQKNFAILQRANMNERLLKETWTCDLCGKTGKGKSNHTNHYQSNPCKQAQEKLNSPKKE